MIRLQLEILADSENDIVAAMRGVMEKIEDGYVESVTNISPAYEVNFKVWDPCAYGECDGSGYRQDFEGEDQKCLCLVERHDQAMLDGARGK